MDVTTFNESAFGRAGAAFGVGTPIGASLNIGQASPSRIAATKAAQALGVGSAVVDPRAWQDQTAGRIITNVNKNTWLPLLTALNAGVQWMGDYQEAADRFTTNATNAYQEYAGATAYRIPGLGLLDSQFREDMRDARAAESSPGQTFFLAMKSSLHPDEKAPADSPFALLDDPNRYQERQEYFSGGVARWTSGVIDLGVNIYLDPLMVGGMAAKPLLASARSIKATDVAAASRASFAEVTLDSGAPNLTKGARKITATVNRATAALIDASNRPGGLAELSRSRLLAQSGDGGAIPYAVSRLMQDPELRSFESVQRLLYAGMGDRSSLAWLREQNELLEIELRSLAGPNKDLVVHEILTSNRYDHLSALRAANADGDADRVIQLVKDDILATRQGYERVHAIGSPASDGMEAVGVSGLGTIREIPIREQMRVAGVVHRGLGLPPVHVLWGRKLPGHFSLSADDAYDSFASAVMRTAGTLQRKSAVDDTMRGLLDDFATSYGVFDEGAARATRRGIVDRFNHEATERLVAKYDGIGGKTAEEIRAVIQDIRQRRTDQMVHLWERAQGARDDILHVKDGSSGRILAFDPEFTRPFGATMLEDLVTIPDYKEIEKLLKREFRDGFKGYLNWIDGKIDLTDEFLTATTQLWTFAQLARPGYAVRNVIDSQSRNLAMMGAVESGQNLVNGSRNLLYNLGKVSQDELDRLHALVSARSARAQLDDAVFPQGVPARVLNERNRLDDLIHELENGGHGPRVLDLNSKIQDVEAQIDALGEPSKASERLALSRLEAQLDELKAGRDQLIATRVRRQGTVAERHIGMEGNLYDGGRKPKLTQDQRQLLSEIDDLERQLAALDARSRRGIADEIAASPELSALKARNATAVDGSPAWDGGPTLFHGTGKSFGDDAVSADIYAGDGEKNLFGYGFYTTDTPSVARGYSGRKVDGAVYNVQWKGGEPPVILDLEAAASSDLRTFVREAVARAGIKDADSVLKVANDSTATGGALLRAMRTAAEVEPTATWKAIYKDLRDYLDNAGYDALSHRGGQIVGTTDHNVTIFLDPGKIRTVRSHELGPEHIAGQGRANRAIPGDRQRILGEIRVRQNVLDASGDPLVGTMGRSPVFRDIYDYRRSQSAVSLHDSLQQLMQQTYSRWLPEVRGSGHWQHITPADGGWTNAYLDLVNKRIRNDEGLMSLVANPANTDFVRNYYLNTPVGNKIWKSLESRFDSVDELIEFQQAQISMILPTQEARMAVMGAPLAESQIDSIFTKGIPKPAVGAEMLDTAASNAYTALVNRYLKTREWWFKHVGEMPEENLSRHPFFVNRKRGHMDALWPVDADGQAARLTVKQANALYLKADKLARRDVANYLFDTSSRSNLSSYMRFMSPFYSAWSDTMRKWMRIIGYNPVAGVVLPKAFTAMNSAFVVVDQDGNRILPNGHIVNANGEVVGRNDDPTAGSIVIPIPEWLSGQWNGNGDIYLSKSSLNVTLQGEPFWLPSMGPLAAVPANEVILGMFPEQADSTWAKYLLPFGTSSSQPLDQASPMWVKNLATLRDATFNPENSADSRLMQTWGDLYAAKVNQVRLGEIPPMTQSELIGQVNNEARNVWIMRFFSNWFGFTLQPKSRLEFYRKEWQRYRREYGYENAEARFYQDYPDYYEAMISLSENQSGIAATDESWANTQRYSASIRRNPEYGWMYVGAANLEPGFSQGVYTAQQRLGLRGQKRPEQALRDVQVNDGWRKYGQMQDAVNAQLEARVAAGGSGSIQNGANFDLDQFRDAAIAALKKENPTWAEEFARGSTGTSLTAFFNAAETAVSDHRELALRSDFVVLQEYMDAREQMRAYLDSIGAATVDSPEAPEGLSEFWDAYKRTLVGRDLGFEQMYNRAGLDRDIVARG